MRFSLKISFILFIIYLSSYFIKSNSDLNNDTQKKNYEMAINFFPISYLAYIIKGFLPKIGNESFLEDSIGNCSCFISYLNISNNSSDIEKILDIIRYSAKSYPDFGNEEGCINKKYAFLLFSIKFNMINPIEYNGKFKLLPFISSGHSFYGLCLENNTNCTNDLDKMLDTAINQNKLINQKYNLKTFINYLDGKKEIKNNIKLNIYFIQFILFLIYFLIRIVICIYGLKFFKEDDLNNKKKGNDSSSSDEEEEEEQEDNKQEENIENKSGQLMLEKNKVVIISNKEKYPKFFFFFKFCSFKLGFKYLFKNKSSLYDESDLYSIIFFKFMSLILKTFYMNLHSLIYIPSKEINNINFFNGNFIIFMKYSSFSDVIFIIAESIIVGYKLMSFIRKYTEKNKEPSLELFINFFFRIIPSFFTVFIIFFIFYFLCEEMMYAMLIKPDLFNRTRLQYLRDKLINCDCVNNWKALIPFYIQYNNINEQFLQEKECFKFIIFMTNMFYCYLIVILLTFISFKIKRKIYDYFIIIIFLINYIVPNNFSCKSLTDETIYTNINILFGETCSIKFTHLFIKYYFFGFLIGLSLFYNNDITHEKSLQNSSIYKPFHFLQDIIGFIYLRSFIFKLIIIILTIIIQAALSYSFSYYINNSIFKNIQELNNSNFKYIQELNAFDNSLYLNEKTIFAFVFGLMIIIFYIFKNESVFKGFCNNAFTILLNRIGFGYYSLLEIIINYIYCFAELEVQLNYVNFIFITTGIIFYILIFNIILYVLYEIPVKILIKNMLHIKVEERLGYKI